MKDIRKLEKEGRIKGHTVSLKKKPPVVSGAIGWLNIHLELWSRKQQIEMKTEFRFDKERKWRFDYAWPALKVAVEYEGGIFLQKSGHNTARHYTKDTEKYNQATVLGWRMIRVTAMNYKTVIELLNKVTI